jgi:hypothetical protein
MNLGQRAAACHRWRWIDGMRDAYGYRYNADMDQFEKRRGRTSTLVTHEHMDCVPDFDDPATLGAMTALVRESWGAGDAVAVCSEVFRGHHCVTQRTRQSPGDLPDRFIAWGHTEVEALVAALEAAP